jgi:hypothetical protein
MSEENPPPLRPWVIPLIVLAIDAVLLAFAALFGGFAKLSPGMQFYLGAWTFGFPIIIYLFLKRRARRGDE